MEFVTWGYPTALPHGLLPLGERCPELAQLPELGQLPPVLPFLSSERGLP